MLIKITVIVTIIITLVGCDDDFNSVGSEVIGGVNFQDSTYTSTPVAFNRRFERVQTSGLPNNLLGVYNDPIYGQSVYSVLSQILPSTLDPTFGNEAVLDSIVLSLPYFSELTETTVDDNGVVINTYELDSIYGSSTDSIRLSVYQSDYFLRDFDIDQGAEERQIYFSNDVIDNFGPAVEETLIATVNNFIPSNKEIILLTEDGEDEDEEPEFTSENPRFRLALISDAAAIAANELNPPENIDNERFGNQDVINHFTELFIDREGSIELSNANNFYNYFRGIYIKAEPINGNGNLVFFDIANANITLHYSFDTTIIDSQDEDGDGNVEEFTRDTGDLTLNFSNNIVNSIETDFNTTIAEELADQDEVNGEENLYLKGGEGSYAIIELFSKDVINENGELENELDFLKRQEWLINEASIKFYINQNQVVGGDTEPERIYMFELETGDILFDYAIDPTLNTLDPVLSITEHLGRISRESDEAGEFYKIRITQHLINILNEDSENVTLGLSVSQNVNLVANGQGFTPTNTEDEIVPLSSIISHEGTVLYGNGANVPADKNLVLDIFFTESINN